MNKSELVIELIGLWTIRNYKDEGTNEIEVEALATIATDSIRTYLNMMSDLEDEEAGL